MRFQILITFGDQRASEFVEVEEFAGVGRHVGGGNPRSGFVPECHPQAQALPLHATTERAVGSADDFVGSQE